MTRTIVRTTEASLRTLTNGVSEESFWPVGPTAPVAGVATAGVLVSKPATELFTVSGGSTPWKISGCGVHITVISNVRGDVETVLDTFPGLHFPVTRSTVGYPTELSFWSDRPAACHAAG